MNDTQNADIEVTGRSARYDHEAHVWRDAETGAVVPSEPDAAWIAGGVD